LKIYFNLFFQSFFTLCIIENTCGCGAATAAATAAAAKIFSRRSVYGVYTYALVENMGGAAAVLFWGCSA